MWGLCQAPLACLPARGKVATHTVFEGDRAAYRHRLPDARIARRASLLFLIVQRDRCRLSSPSNAERVIALRSRRQGDKSLQVEIRIAEAVFDHGEPLRKMAKRVFHGNANSAVHLDCLLDHDA